MSSRPPRSRQYQQLAFVAVIAAAPVVTAIENTTLSSQVFYKGRFQYQSHTEPVFTPESLTVDKWFRSWTDPVRQKPGLKTHQQDAYTAPDAVIPTPPPFISTVTAEPAVIHRVIYQSIAQPVPVTELITIDKWVYPWTDPVKQKPGLRTSLQQAAIGPVLDDETQIIQGYESRWHYAWSEPVRVKPRVQVGSNRHFASPIFVPEVITVDKWIYPWTEPVRQKAGLRSYLQQTFTTDTVVLPTSTALEWFNWLSDPVRQKPGLRTGLNQDFIAPVLDDETQIIQTYESRWHYAWSEPVRLRRFPTAEQQALVQQEPSFEIINIDKWGYPWSEPVRQKPGLRAHLQQSLIATTLDPDTQITIGFESLWHYAWSEPVRIKRQVPAGEQQAQIQGFVFSPEIITVDKWIYPWSEPVRQKPGLRTGLNQDLVAPVLDPATQITTGFESLWHYPWSEPVRFRRFPTAEQQALIFQLPPLEIVTIDKWLYPFSEPVRQKIGFKAHLQQVFAATTLNPETQLTQFFESRWHQPWSEPVRLKRGIPATEQQTIALPAVVAELITVDKWIYPWTDPVRQKPGLRVSLQQALIAPVLDDETQIIQGFESRWHYAWSEPVRFRRLATAQQQFISVPAVPVSETNTVDKWVYPWSEPVRQKIGQKAYLQQDFIGVVLEPNSQIIQGYESQWHYAWSEPVRVRRLAVAQQQSHAEPPTSQFEVITVDKWIYPFTDPVRFRIDPKRAITLAAPFIAGPVLNPNTQITQFFESRWHQPWSEPKRFKTGLGAWLQQTTSLATPPFPTFVKTINWFAPLNEPVRLKLGLMAGLQRFFQTSQEQILPDVFVSLLATEVNTDSAFFGVTVYNAVPVITRLPSVVVSIKEIEAIRTADASVEEKQAIDNAAVSIEET